MLQTCRKDAIIHYICNGKCKRHKIQNKDKQTKKQPGTMSRIDDERRTVRLMIGLYCRRKEGNKRLCDECKAMAEYADERLSRCRFGESKPTCRLCTVHCYRKDMRVKMKEIMRFSGPRMLIYHPIAAIKHIVRETLRK